MNDGGSPPDMQGVDAAADAALDMAPPVDRGVDPEPDAGADAAAPDAAPPAPDAAAAEDAGPTPCSPALALAPAETWTEPGALVFLRPSGGSGRWRFALAEDASGASVNVDTGAYLAGPRGAVTDVVRLTDPSCAGSADARIHVTAPLEIAPRRVEVAPGGAIAFEAQGGSGAYAFRLSVVRSGAEITADGRYVAGAGVGFDVVEAVDARTGAIAQAIISVDPDPRFALDAPLVYLPVGATARLLTQGGSGAVQLEIDGDAVLDAGDGRVTARSPGRSVIDVIDRFTGQRTEAIVQVRGAVETPVVRFQNTASAGVTLAPGDLDGDGFPELLLGLPAANVNGVADGGVYLYAGGPEGMGGAPRQIIGGVRGDASGSAIALADFDGDGRRDLAIGATRAEGGARDSGHVRIHAGRAAGDFGPEPTQIVVSEVPGAELGSGLAACDFNGDGRLDLAIGVRRPRRVVVHLGTDAGLAPTPIVTLRAQLPGPDGWAPAEGDLGFGVVADALVAADFDEDGLCDLAAGLPFWAPPPQRREAGAVLIFRGRAGDEDTPGGVERTPSRLLVADDPDTDRGRFGWRLAAGTLGDHPVLLVGQEGWDGPDLRDAGALHLFRRPLSAGPELRSAAVATWRAQGARGDRLGVGVALSPDTVWAGANGMEDEDSPPDAGAVLRFPIDGEGMPGAPRILGFGGSRNVGFGQAVAPVGDVDGDGFFDAFTFAPTDEGVGVRVGRGFVIAGVDGALSPLPLPGPPGAGSRIGAALAAGDVDGDGAAELIVGAPDAASPPAFLAGGVFVLSIAAGMPVPLQDIFGPYTMQDGGRLGADLASGDFDADGFDDLAVNASHGEAPLARDVDGFIQIRGACAPRANDQGMVYLHRGGPPGLADAPDFLWPGPQPGARAGSTTMADVDGDGRADVVIGTPLLAIQREDVDEDGMPIEVRVGEVGGLQILRGRPPADQPLLICDPHFELEGTASRARLGLVTAGLGDLDGDGCDEVALSEGLSVHVLFGWGAGCAAIPRWLRVRSDNDRSGAVTSVAAVDVIGDPRPDLVLGYPDHQAPGGGSAPGAVFVLDGADLADVAPTPVADGPGPELRLPPARRTRIGGQVHAERFGAAVAAVGDVLVVGHTRRRLGDRFVGGASAWRASPSGWAQVAVIVGETWRNGSGVGARIVRVGAGSQLAISGPRGSGRHADAGAVYVYDLEAVIR